MTVLQALLLPIATAAVAALILASVQRWGWLRRRLLFGPMRRAARRRMRTELEAPRNDDDGQPAALARWTAGWLGARRSPWAVRARSLVSALESDYSDHFGAGTWELLVADHGITRRDLDDLTALLDALVAPGAHNIVVGLLFADRRRELRERALSAVRAAEGFRHLRPVEGNDEARAFARWATEAVGAPILADPLDARAGVARAVRVWSSAEYVGHPQVEANRYDDVHPGDAGCPAATEVSRAGDYDGRVLVVGRVSTEEDRQTGELVYVVETVESCYAVTEQGEQEWGCKQIPPPAAGDGQPGTALRGETEVVVTGERRPLLTSFISLMTADRQLVLCRRSDKTRSGQRALSAAAGGVFEPGSVVGAPIDRSPLGWPDPEGSVRRELREELGVDLTGRPLAPAVVFLANLINWRSVRGQLVVCTLYLTQCELTFDELRTGVFGSSDLASGRFEVDDLVGFDLSRGIEHFASEVQELSAEMDQHGALSCLYAARTLWDGETTMTAMSPVFGAGSEPRRSVLWEPARLGDGVGRRLAAGPAPGRPLAAG